MPGDTYGVYKDLSHRVLYTMSILDVGYLDVKLRVKSATRSAHVIVEDRSVEESDSMSHPISQ